MLPRAPTDTAPTGFSHDLGENSFTMSISHARRALAMTTAALALAGTGVVALSAPAEAAAKCKLKSSGPGLSRYYCIEFTTIKTRNDFVVADYDAVNNATPSTVTLRCHAEKTKTVTFSTTISGTWEQNFVIAKADVTVEGGAERSTTSTIGSDITMNVPANRRGVCERGVWRYKFVMNTWYRDCSSRGCTTTTKTSKVLRMPESGTEWRPRITAI